MKLAAGLGVERQFTLKVRVFGEVVSHEARCGEYRQRRTNVVDDKRRGCGDLLGVDRMLPTKRGARRGECFARGTVSDGPERLALARKTAPHVGTEYEDETRVGRSDLLRARAGIVGRVDAGGDRVFGGQTQRAQARHAADAHVSRTFAQTNAAGAR